MTTVTLDVPAARDAVDRLGALSSAIDERVARVRRAAAVAREDVPSLAGAPEWADDLRTRAGDLRARVDLALELTGADGSAGPLTYDVPTDTGTATRELLGEALGLALLAVEGDEEQGAEDLELLERWTGRAERWVDHAEVAPALVATLGRSLLEVTARTGRVGFDAAGLAGEPAPGPPAAPGTPTSGTPAAPGTPASGRGRSRSALPAARLVRRALLTASGTWDADLARAVGGDLARDAVQGASRGTGLALAFLLQRGTGRTDLAVGVADGLDDHERGTGSALDLTGARAAALGNELADAFGPEEEGDAHDPMALALRALAASPRDALDWWLAGPDGGLARQRHWVGARSWAHEGARGLVASLAAATSDRAVLLAAATDDEQVALWERAASLASTALPLLARRPEPLPAGPSTSEALAGVLARWLPALDAALSWTAPPDPDDLDDPDASDASDDPSGGPLRAAVTSVDLRLFGLPLPPLPVLTPEDLQRLCALALADASGQLVLRAGADDLAALTIACAADLVAAAHADGASDRDRLVARQQAQTALLELAVREGALLAALPASSWACAAVLEPLPAGTRGAAGPGGHLDLHRHLATGLPTAAPAAPWDPTGLVALWSQALAQALADRGLAPDAAGALGEDFWDETRNLLSFSA